MPEMEVFGFNTAGWLAKASQIEESRIEQGDGPIGTIAIVGSDGSVAGVAETFAEDLSEWQVARIKQAAGQVFETVLPSGPLWVVALPIPRGEEVHGGYLGPSPYGLARDFVGAVFRFEQILRCKKLVVVFDGASKDEKLGALVGLEVGSYLYKDPNRNRLPPLVIGGCTSKLIEDARSIGASINLARHLVNTPANLLDPTSYAEVTKQLFKGSSHTKVEVWDFETCKKEKLNLLCAVGQASEHKPCLIHIKYRPKIGRKKSSVAYVGKGITFDSGGLDIKPADGMRLMKKDMGGSASILGLAYWLDRVGFDHPADFYLAVAENAISGNAFRPGDVLKAKNGISVEIDNTDAEGRLVLADALCVAAAGSGKEQPKQIINLATLTGAMRVALGVRIAGMFSNSDDLADQLADAAYALGEPMWRMPLYGPYRDLLNSTAADMSNSGGRFGGAITAALFLERFVNDIPWAHLDIFTWADRQEGCWLEPGGSGQGVQLLIGFIQGKR